MHLPSHAHAGLVIRFVHSHVPESLSRLYVCKQKEFLLSGVQQWLDILRQVISNVCIFIFLFGADEQRLGAMRFFTLFY